MNKVSLNLWSSTHLNRSAKQFILSILKHTDITINGQNPWDVQIHNENFYARVVKYGILGLGESYMDGWWHCQHLDQFFDKILSAHLDRRIQETWQFKVKHLLAKVINLQTKNRARSVAHKHYDLGNDLFQLMLDKRMIYSCGYFKSTETLDEAQIDKLDLICKKLNLSPGMRVLDIGCGWGGLAKYMSENYRVHVTGITISKQQCDYAKHYCQDLPIDIRLQDYRDVHETFDRVVSVGMFEHVGHLNYPAFMKIIHQALTSDGLFLLHTIGGNETSNLANEWVTKYIFPNGMLPSIAQIGRACEKLFVMEDWHNFGAYYDLTLMAWYQNFTEHWQQLKQNYDERFYRMWSYYLLSSAGSFRSRYNQLWQIVLSKNGVRGGYLAPR